MQSSFPHGYQYDLFISYSSDDVEWVRPFYEALNKDVTRIIGREIVTFWDKDGLKTGDTWSEKLRHASANSATLVAILTPTFFESKYCSMELDSFLHGFSITGDAVHRSRIFPVELLCPAPKEHPLSACQATRFWGKNRNGNPIEFDHSSAEFKDAIRDLSVAIKAVLPNITPKNDLAPKSSGRAAVYLADNFLDQSRVLRNSLSHKYDVLPAAPAQLMKMDAAEFEKHVQESLAQCFVSIHPLDRKPAADYLVKAQLDLARKSGKSRLVLTTAQSDELTELTNAGFEWFDSQQDIEERIRVLNAQPPPPPPRSEETGSKRMIYFLCQDAANRSEAEPLLDILQQEGVDIWTSPLSGSADEALTKHVKALESLDGCLIYYGNTERDWFDTVFLRLRRHIQERRLRSAIYVGPPPDDFKEHGLKWVGVPLLNKPHAAASYFAGDRR